MVDVARHAGVSQKTVSRVVNNAPYVRPDVRDKVNAGDRGTGLSAERRRPGAGPGADPHDRRAGPGHRPERPVPAGVHPRAGGPPARLHHGAGLGARPVGRAASAEGVASLLDRGVEGVVVEVPTHLVEFDAAQLAGLPVVTSAGRIAGIARQAVVDVDQATLCRELTQYLLGLGHETVWHIAGPRDWDAAQKRLLGWRCGAAGSGPPSSAGALRRLVGPLRLRAGTHSWRAAADVTAIFAANDHMAMGVLRALGRGRPGSRRRLGRRLRRRPRGRVPDGAADHGRDRRRRGGASASSPNWSP